MKLLTFFQEFPTEQSCKAHFIDLRLKQVIICKKCENNTHYWLQGKEQFQCKSCGFRTTLRSGTLLHHTKLPFQYWYIAIHLMTQTKKGFSAHEVRRQLEHKRYEPIWSMMHKIRSKMGTIEEQTILKDMVSIDDAYLSTHTSQLIKKKLNKEKVLPQKAKLQQW